MKVLIFCSFLALVTCVLSNQLLKESMPTKNVVGETPKSTEPEDLAPRHLFNFGGSIGSVLNIGGGNDDKDLKIHGPNDIKIHEFKPTPTAPMHTTRVPLTADAWANMPTTDAWERIVVVTKKTKPGVNIIIPEKEPSGEWEEIHRPEKIDEAWEQIV